MIYTKIRGVHERACVYERERESKEKDKMKWEETILFQILVCQSPFSASLILVHSLDACRANTSRQKKRKEKKRKKKKRKKITLL